MTIHKKKPCAICNKTVSRFTRKYRGEGYCQNCYKRFFVKRECPKCGALARLPREDPEAICRKCEAAKPCIRCGGTNRKLGKLTLYGPVCNSCSVYFRTPRPCPRCGKLSRRLSRVHRLGIKEQVCPKCGELDKGTCRACGRHRRLYESILGKMVCKACLEVGITPCPTCGNDMPAGIGKQCDECYRHKLLEKRLAIDLVAFKEVQMAAQFTRFGSWLERAVGAHKASNTIHRYLNFFLKIESQWGRIPSYRELLKYFGVSKLRRNQLPVRWMEERKLVVIDHELKERENEKRRIKSLLGRFDQMSAASQLLQKYYDELVQRLSYRSIRLALVPAVGLLSIAVEKGGEAPNQQSLNAYIKRVPGQRAGVTGFMHFLNKEASQQLTLPPKTNAATIAKRKKLEKELVRHLANGGEGRVFNKRLLGIALAYFHNIPVKAAASAVKHYKSDAKGGAFVCYAGNRYWIPGAVIDLLA